MIPISAIRLAPHVQAAAAAALASGQLAQGPEVQRFEAAFAEFSGSEHAVAVNSGTAALVAALTALGVGAGDEVITTPFTFVATVNAILESGATVRFADIRADDFALDPAAVQAAITPRTAAIVVAHLFGQCADMGGLTALTAQRGLALVEDAAQAHGAEWNGQRAGSFGTGCFSFYATKNITTGEGGMVTTRDARLAERVRRLRNHGMEARYVYLEPGHNWRMTDFQAAIGRAQLDGYDDLVATRSGNAARLTAGLERVDAVALPEVLPGRRHVWHHYTVMIDQEGGVDRDALAGHLAAQGVGSAVHYPAALSDLAMYRSHPRVCTDADVPTARRCAQRVLSLPVHQHLGPDDPDRIVDAVRQGLRSLGS